MDAEDLVSYPLAESLAESLGLLPPPLPRVTVRGGRNDGYPIATQLTVTL